MFLKKISVVSKWHSGYSVFIKSIPISHWT
jgi:hypothetical protein